MSSWHQSLKNYNFYITDCAFLPPYSRNLDSVTQILDSLADAVLKYEKLEHNEVGQTRQAKVLL